MPGCGKTTVSRQLAQTLNRPWFDSDQEIEDAERMSIADLFASKGEDYFRRRETVCIRHLLNQEDGVIIAVGGGAVLRNAGLLRQKATIIYLRRSLPDILATLKPGTRPLLEDQNNIYELYEERRALYEQLAAITIDNDGSLEDTVQKIEEALRCTY